MRHRSKRTRLAHVSQVEDAVQVFPDVATTEDQAAETLHSSSFNHVTDSTTIPQPTDAPVVEADDAHEEIPRRGQSVSSLPRRQIVAGLEQPRTLHRRPLQVHRIDSQPIGGTSGGDEVAQATGSDRNYEIYNPFMTEPTERTTMRTDDLICNQAYTSGRESLTSSSSQSDYSDSPSQLDALHDYGGEPAHGRSQARRVKPTRWSNDIEVDEMEEVEMRDSEGRRGKKGGKIPPRHVWSLQPGVRIVVPFNSLDQPVRKGGEVLLRFLGNIARKGELCPIGDINWPRVDKNCKAKIVALVREKFVLPDGQEIDKGILKHVGNKWRSHRHNLKLKYKKPDKTQEQVASIVPRGVIPSQWVKLVQYWFSEKCKKFSEVSKDARAAQLHIHTAGNKSFARKRDEFVKAHGREPGPLEWFIETHKKKDGTFADDSTKEFVDIAAAMIAQRGSTSSPSRRTDVENQVFNELMYSDDERLSRRPIGYGFGVNGDKVFGVEADMRKRGCMTSTAAEPGSSKNQQTPVSSVDLNRLNIKMTAMSKTNELMQAQIQVQSQQLRMQSKQIEGLQFQLQRVTDLLTNSGAMLHDPQTDPRPRGAPFHGMNRQAPEVSSENSDGGESDSTEWDSD